MTSLVGRKLMPSRSTALIFLLLFCCLQCGSNYKPGEAKGSIDIPADGISVALKYAYARKVNAPDGQAYSILLTDKLVSADVLKGGGDFSDAVRQETGIHYLIDDNGKIINRELNVSPSAGINYTFVGPSKKAEGKSISIGADSIEGELTEGEEFGIDKKRNWSYRVVFKSSILKQ
jgi:hypothetical protein